MKTFNKNSILFLSFAIAIIIGLYGECFQSLASNLYDSFSELKSGHVKNAISTIKYTNYISTEKLLYHDQLVDINSLENNLINTRFIKKTSGNTVKCNEDMLAMINSERFNQQHLDTVAGVISELQNKSESCGAKFLYLAVPEKDYYQTFPSNIRDYSKMNFDDYLDCLKEKNVPVLSYIDEFRKRGMQNEDIYYYTDTHWTTNVGLLAAQLACDSLHERYGFSFDNSKLNITNYNQTLYKDWFLGALGKKVGTYFTWHGADDFNLITPRFETNLLLEEPLKNVKKEGAFEDTVLYLDNLEKDYYSKDSYSTYSGGNRQLQVVKNQLNPNGKKVLIVRDSFACVVTPFLALQTSELHICDVRKCQDGEKINIENYINKINPDYVIVLYAGVRNPDNSLYNFF